MSEDTVLGLSTDSLVVPRRISRDPSPLALRRVRDEGGREGRIESAYEDGQVWIVWDDAPMQNGWQRAARVSTRGLSLIDAPDIDTPVRIRKVLFRGHKEQVAEKLKMLGPPPEGAERYVEYDPQPMAYRRWRIVYVGPPLDSERVASTPDVYPAADRLRKAAREAVDYDPEPSGYGF